MTERRLRLAPLAWATPGAAAVFAALTGWAMQVTPHPSVAAAPPPQQVPAPRLDPALQASVRAQSQQVAELRQRVGVLSQQLRALNQQSALAAPAPGAQRGAGSAGAPGQSAYQQLAGAAAAGSPSGGSSAGGAPVVIGPPQPANSPPTSVAAAPPAAPSSAIPSSAAPPPAASPAPPPPTVVTTGASGAKK